MRPGHLQLILDLDHLAANAPDRRPGELAAAAACGGVDSIQLRAKSLGAGALLDRTLAVIESLQAAGAEVPVLVNERLDVALLAGAGGVHLPERSLGPLWARSCRELARRAAGARSACRSPARGFTDGGPGEMAATATSAGVGGAARGFLVGRSVHGSAGAAAPGTDELDYLIFGHVFATDSKPGASPRGIDALSEVVSVAPVPVLAVGGIHAQNAARVIEAGAAGIAVISAICSASDPYEATKALRRAVDAAVAPAIHATVDGTADTAIDRTDKGIEGMRDPGTEPGGLSMRVVVNGRPCEVEPETTILEFLESRSIDVRSVAVARNEEIVPRRSFAAVRLCDGDVLEVIKVVAGG